MFEEFICGAPVKRSLVFHRSDRGEPVSYRWMGLTETIDKFRPEMRPHAIMVVEYLGCLELFLVVPFRVN
jgi:hypothetical protein